MDSLSPRVKRGARLESTEGGEPLSMRLSAEHFNTLNVSIEPAYEKVYSPGLRREFHLFARQALGRATALNKVAACALSRNVLGKFALA